MTTIVFRASRGVGKFGAHSRCHGAGPPAHLHPPGRNLNTVFVVRYAKQRRFSWARNPRQSHKEAGQLEALDIKMDHYSGDPLAQANRGRGMNPAMLNMV